MNAISLFSCIGVSEYYLKDLGVDVLVASDIDKKRCSVHQFLYPETTMVCGDIKERDVKDAIIKAVGKKTVDLIISTPPCQGLSTVGKNKGKALTETNDPRNYLLLETFDFIDKFDPSFVVFENVPQLLKVKLLFEGEYHSVETILTNKYGEDYSIDIKVFNTCDYGVPQNRERVFIRMYKKNLEWKDPVPADHVITLREAIGDLPSLEPNQRLVFEKGASFPLTPPILDLFDDSLDGLIQPISRHRCRVNQDKVVCHNSSFLSDSSFSRTFNSSHFRINRNSSQNEGYGS